MAAITEQVWRATYLHVLDLNLEDGDADYILPHEQKLCQIWHIYAILTFT